MSVFRRNSNASDAIASHYLTNTICVNCQRDAWAYFEPPSAEWRQQCGGIDCSGPNNYLIDDQDGEFTGQIGQIIANNSVLLNQETNCSFISALNGHLCNFSSFAIL